MKSMDKMILDRGKGKGGGGAIGRRSRRRRDPRFIEPN